MNFSKIKELIDQDDLVRISNISKNICELHQINLNKYDNKSSSIRLLNNIRKGLLEICAMTSVEDVIRVFGSCLDNYVIYISAITVFVEKSKKGVTYEEYIFNNLKLYLWPEYSDLTLKEFTGMAEYNDLQEYSEVVRHRRNKNLMDNEFVRLEKREYRNNYAYGSQIGKRGRTYKPIRIEKEDEFGLINVLSHYSNTSICNELKQAVFSFTIDKMKNSSLNIDTQILEEIRGIYRRIEQHKKVTFHEYKKLQIFMYEYYKLNPNFTWINIQTLEKKMFFKGMLPIIYFWNACKDKKLASDEFLIELTKAVLRMPSYSLRLKYIEEINRHIRESDRVNIIEIQNTTLYYEALIQMKISYIVAMLMILWEQLYTAGMTEDQMNMYANILHFLSNAYADHMEVNFENLNCDSYFENTFEIIYNNLYPPKPKQKRRRN